MNHIDDTLKTARQMALTDPLKPLLLDMIKIIEDLSLDNEDLGRNIVAQALNLANDQSLIESQQKEIDRLTDLNRRIAEVDDVAKAYQQVYFEDFPIVSGLKKELIQTKFELVKAKELLGIYQKNVSYD